MFIKTGDLQPINIFPFMEEDNASKTAKELEELKQEMSKKEEKEDKDGVQ